MSRDEAARFCFARVPAGRTHGRSGCAGSELIEAAGVQEDPVAVRPDIFAAFAAFFGFAGGLTARCAAAASSAAAAVAAASIGGAASAVAI
ncbi:hypothetical protein, partial [Burkholderia pseudomallei]|uniref:hypothetical protein n=1 Tax=Burkholderia pseudomallei TaxID=28450 RepID=UPI0021F6A6D8